VPLPGRMRRSQHFANTHLCTARASLFCSVCECDALTATVVHVEPPAAHNDELTVLGTHRHALNLEGPRPITSVTILRHCTALRELFLDGTMPASQDSSASTR
jgi:hypothetical protein